LFLQDFGVKLLGIFVTTHLRLNGSLDGIIVGFVTELDLRSSPLHGAVREKLIFAELLTTDSKGLVPFYWNSPQVTILR